MLTKRPALLVAGVALALFASGCSWSTFGFDPARTGYNPFETTIGVGNVASLQERWSAADVGSDIWSSPVVSGGVTYIGGTDSRLYAFDANGVQGCSGPLPNTCAPLWTALTGGYVSTPSVSDGVVYVGSEDDHLYAFDAEGVTGCSGTPKTCVPLWSANTGGYGYPGTATAVVDGVVYVGTDDHKLYAFDAAGQIGCSGSPKTCAPLWTATITDSPYFTQVSTPAVAKGVVYVTKGPQLYAFDAAGRSGCSRVIGPGSRTCAPLWRATGPTVPTVNDVITLQAPAVAGDVVYAGSHENPFVEPGPAHLYAFDAKGLTGCSVSPGSPKTCVPLWSVMTAAQVERGSPAVANGLVYVSTNSFRDDPDDGSPFGFLEVFDTSGARVWTSVQIHASFTSPAVANGVVYVGSGEGMLYAFDAAGAAGCSGIPTTCAPLWAAPKGGPSSPTVVNGVVYFGSVRGNLHAFGLP